MSVDLISQLIAQIVASKPGIFGSQLGAAVKKMFPAFTGLRSFVEKHCPNTVIITPTPGGDDSYFLNNSTDSAQWSQNHLAGGAVPFFEAGLRKQPTFWQAFTNPSKPQCLTVNTSLSALGIEDSVECVQPPWAVVSKVSPEEHQEIAHNFIESLPESDRPQFAGVLKGNNWWHAWKRSVAEVDNGKHEASWLDFRTAGLVQLFEQRLSSLKIPPATVEDLKAQLQQSKRGKGFHIVAPPDHQTHSNPPPIPEVSDMAKPQEGFIPGADKIDMRRLVMTIVAQLSEEDLARIWLPLGPTLDALRNRNG